MPIPLAVVGANMARRVASHEAHKLIDDPEHRQRRSKQIKRAVGALVLTGCAGVGGYYGWGDEINEAITSGAGVSSSMTVAGGEEIITKIDLNYQRTCWTSSEVSSKGTTVKVAPMKIAGIEPVWRSSTVDVDFETELCIDPTDVSATKNQKTQEITLQIKDASAIRTDIQTVPGSIIPAYQGSPIDGVANALSDVTRTLPLIQDIGLTKLAATTKDSGDAQLTNIAVIKAEYDTKDCAAATWNLTKSPIKHGLQNIVYIGQKLDHPDMKIDQIKIMVGDKNIDDVSATSIGTKSNIDNYYQKMVDAGKDDNLELTQGSSRTCTTSPDLGKIMTPTVVSQNGGIK